MFKPALTSIALAATLLSAGSVKATIINIDALTGTSDVGPVELSAGNWRIDPIIDDFTAWNAWGRETGCDSNGEDCTRGWIYRYFVESAQLGTVGLGTASERFELPIQALNNAAPFFFSLAASDTLEFSIRDSNLRDNEGGISVQINRVSEPGTLALVGFGLAGVAASRRRRR
ncbi:MAG: PEP-CTERM sorting domain-containing protein [Pseudomonadota bacterium]